MLLMGWGRCAGRTRQPPWGKAALTAQRDQAQVQRRAFPVTELCASESREFLFCFRDFFKKQTD